MKPPKPIHRSGLTFPINNAKFLDKAWTRGCDGFQLDLQDSVPQAQKAHARTLCKAAIESVSRAGGEDVEIRINQASIEADIAAAVWPGLKSIRLGHTLTAEQVRLADACITKMELLRGIPPGSIELGISPDSVYSTVGLEEIALASPRIRSFGAAGGYDYALSLGIEMFTGLDALFYPSGLGNLLARAHGKQGTTGSTGSAPRESGNVSDDENAFRRAVEARKLGSRRMHGLHPAVVEPFNRGMTPPAEEVEEAKRIVEFWQRLDAAGEVEGSMEGKIVDRYEARNARELIDWSRQCAEVDAYKAMKLAEARAKAGGN